jgi:hemoglobin/transferrin/lactoferrin receptor protein
LPLKSTKLSILGSSGYRTPNIDDLAKVYESVAGNLLVPNPDIKPEYSFNTEFSINQKIKNIINLEATFYITALKNVIVVSDFELDGKKSINYLGVESRILASQNKDKGIISGWNINAYAQINKCFKINTTLNKTTGKLGGEKYIPLDHIPPVFGKTDLIFTKEKIKIEAFSIYNGWKKLKNYSPSGEDNLVFATKDGTPAWWTLNLRTTYIPYKKISLQIAAENILDKNYRTFASGISSSGRNFIFTLRGGF